MVQDGFQEYYEWKYIKEPLPNEQQLLISVDNYPNHSWEIGREERHNHDHETFQLVGFR